LVLAILSKYTTHPLT